MRKQNETERIINKQKRNGKKAGKKLKLVKMGPYDDDSSKRKEWLDLANAWLEGGGDGIVAVNTYLIPREKVPSENWGYQSAGRSGRFLQEYRQRAIRDARKNFPNAIIIATGGIDSAEQAWQAFEEGANAVEGYTPYTFKGFGLLLEMLRGVKKSVEYHGYKYLEEFQLYNRRKRK